MSSITLLIVIGALMATVLGGVTLLNHIYNLNHIKSKTVGDGQLVSSVLGIFGYLCISFW